MTLVSEVTFVGGVTFVGATGADIRAALSQAKAILSSCPHSNCISLCVSFVRGFAIVAKSGMSCL